MTAAQLIEQSCITQAWTMLGGGELRHGRGQAFWRKGADGWSVSLNDDRGTWYDHRDGIGGGILDLIQHVRGGSRGKAARWLADYRGVELDGRPLSTTDRRRYAHARQAASAMASDIEHWRDAFTIELNKRKIAAVAAADFGALGRAAKLCRVLESGSPEEISREFIRHRAANPEDTARLITEGRERDIEAQRITAECVLLLACAVEREGLHAAA